MVSYRHKKARSDDVAILKIGSLDLSEYCEKGDFSVSRSGVYSSGFTGIGGNVKKKLLGYKYQISAAFNDVPNDIKKAIESACNAEKVSISFDNTTAEFNAPDITCKLAYETTSGVLIWSVNLSSVCDLAPSGL